jgi:hypothetical protein
LPRQRALRGVIGSAGVVRAGLRAGKPTSPGRSPLRKLLFRGCFSGRRMKSNYMFKPTPELTLRLLWPYGRRGLTWR